MAVRLDALLFSKGLAPSRVQARDMILEGRVTVNGRIIDSPGKKVDEASDVSAMDTPAFVSRSGRKLYHFIRTAGLSFRGLRGLDAGSSTGGFSDVLLKEGVRKLYCVDTGSNQLHESLRKDPRIILMENTDIRNVASLPEEMDFAVADLSFISIKKAISSIAGLVKAGGTMIILVKPQFESERRYISSSGLLPMKYHPAILESLNNLLEQSFEVRLIEKSAIKGKNGNTEYFFLLLK